VDKAYIEYTPDWEQRSAMNLVRDGANVVVRTFDKSTAWRACPWAMCWLRVILQMNCEGAALETRTSEASTWRLPSAALADRRQVERTRGLVAQRRLKRLQLLRELGRTHSGATGSFVFFDTGQPQVVV
jgi:histidinol-phosphate aminotransferase